MTVNRTLGYVIPILAALLSGCNDDDYGYEDRTEVFTTVLPRNVQQLFDNGYMTSFDVLLVPCASSPDHFYFVESPEMLDSVFHHIYYPDEYSGPPLDSLFPEGGSLLVLDFSALCEDEVMDYGLSFSGDTVRVAVDIRNHDGLVMPGIQEVVFPIGVVLQDSVR
ncbi:MAG: hypothetical protein QUS11_01525 [Candidatus Fermentibacter sp.]|nr:hypothetical protein [Candidatus Fermentibacter sp.]